MPIKQLNASAKRLLRESRRRLEEIKKRLQELSRKEEQIRQDLPPKPPAEKEPQMKVALSVESVVKSTMAILLVLGLVYVLDIIKSTIILFLIALFLSATLNPAVDRLEKRKVPRALGIILMYILIIGVFALIVTSLIPIVADQLKNLASSVQNMVVNIATSSNPDSWIASKLQPFVQQVMKNIDLNEFVSSLSGTLQSTASTLTNFAGDALGVVFAIFNGIINTLLVVIITFYMVLNNKSTSTFFSSLFPGRYADYIDRKTQQVSRSLGDWVRGQLLLALSMGVITFIGFSIIGLNYALTLAMVSALAEFLPYLGPFITFISAALIALNQDPMLVVWLAIAYAVLQFVEGNILVPLIVGKAVHMSPVVVIFALLAGFSIGSYLGDGIGLGIVGMILAVPTANIISIFVADYTGKKK